MRFDGAPVVSLALLLHSFFLFLAVWQRVAAAVTAVALNFGSILINERIICIRIQLSPLPLYPSCGLAII